VQEVIEPHTPAHAIDMDEEELDEEEQMKRMMGFGGFESTKVSCFNHRENTSQAQM
jgi:hypothetical protein